MKGSKQELALEVKNWQKKSGTRQVESLTLTCSGQFAESAFHKWNLLSKLLLIKFRRWEQEVYMLWFSFILGLNLISLCFKLIVLNSLSYIIPKTKRNYNWTKDKLNQQHIIHCSKETKIMPVIGSITKKVAF